MVAADQVQMPVEDIIRVSGGSNPQSVGSALARSIIAGYSPKVRAVGASAANQALKAAAIARSYTAARGLDVAYTVGFDEVEGNDGKTISAIFMRPVIR